MEKNDKKMTCRLLLPSDTAGSKKEINIYLEKRDDNVLLLNPDTGVWVISKEYVELMDCLNEGGLIEFEKLPLQIQRKIHEDAVFEEPVENQDGNCYRLLILESTQRCNMSCKYCFENASAAGCDMTADVAVRAFDLFSSLKDADELINVEFNGGEALLNFKMIEEAVPRIVELALEKSKKVVFTIQTNATLLSFEQIAFLKKHGFSIGVSIDGTEEFNHDRVFRDGKETYHTVMDKIAMLKGCSFSTLSVIKEQGQYMNMLTLSEKVGEKELRANLINGIGKGVASSHKLAEEYILFCKKVFFEKKIYEAGLSYYLMSLLKWNPFMCFKEPCGAGRNQLYVTADGRIFLCQDSCYIGKGCVGTVQDLAEEIEARIRNDEWFNHIQNCLTVEKSECVSCIWKQFCKSCPCKVLAETGDERNKSTQCEFNKYVFEELIWMAGLNIEDTINYLQYNY